MIDYKWFGFYKLSLYCFDLLPYIRLYWIPYQLNIEFGIYYWQCNLWFGKMEDE